METNPQQPGLVREAWTRTKKFVLPDETVSLKTIFDNVRNYLMCAGVFGAVGALGASNRDESLGPFMLTSFAFVLIGANTFQSWLIVQAWTHRIGRFQREVRPGWGRFKRRLMRVFLFLMLVPVVAAMFQGFALLVRWALVGGK